MSIDTVNDLGARDQYTALAAQTVFPYTFPIFEDADLVVVVDGTTKALATDYTVSGETDDTGGDVTFITPMTGGEVVTIYRNIAIERTTDMSQNGPWTSDSINDEFDRIFLILQQLEEENARSLRVPMTAIATNTQTELSPIANWYNKFIYFNSSGVPTPATAVSSTTLSQSTIGEYYRPLSAREFANGVTPTNYYYDYGDIRRFAAAGDNSTDDRTALRNTCKGVGTYGRVYIDPSLTCRVSGPVVDSSLAAYAVGQYWYGGGKITTADGFNFNVFDLSGITDFTVDGIRGESGLIDSSVTYSNATARFFAAKSGSHRAVLKNTRIVGFQSAYQFNNSTGCAARNVVIDQPLCWGGNIQTDADDAVSENVVVTGVAPVTVSAITAANPAQVTTSGAHGFATGDTVVVRYVGGMTEILNATSRITVVNSTTFTMDDVNSSAYTPYTSGGWVRNRLIEHAFYVAGSSGNNVLRPMFARCRASLAAIDGFKFTRCEDGSGSQLVSYSNGGAGFYLTVGCDRFDLGNGILAYDNRDNGIIVFDSTEASDGNRVHDFESRKNYKNGVSVSSSGSGSVADTQVYDGVTDDNDQDASGSQYGVVLSDADNARAVVRNITARNEVIGIRVASGVVGAVLEDNRFVSCSTDISNSGTGTQIGRPVAVSSYTGTLTGCTTSPTGTIEYSVKGDQVTLEIPAVSATSNTTAATVTGMPAAIYPSAAQTVIGITTDNGTTAFGKIIVGTDGVLTLHVAQSATFTNTGTKGVAACTVTYRLT